MAIIQGSNTPITLVFSRDMSDIKNFNASLWRGSSKLKQWGIEDVNIIQNTIELPLTEKDTLSFIPGRAIIEAKWLPNLGDIELAKEASIIIDARKDKTEVIVDELP